MIVLGSRVPVVRERSWSWMASSVQLNGLSSVPAHWGAG